jgi:hypothetical protein
LLSSGPDAVGRRYAGRGIDPAGEKSRWKGRSVVRTQGEQPKVTQGEEPRKPSLFKRFVDWVLVLFT